MSKPERKQRVLIACSGVERIKRGFETFAIECFKALSQCSDLDVYFAKGSGELSEREFKVFTLSRVSSTAKILAWVFKKHPYYIEQISFGIFMLPKIFKLKPDVIYFSDGTLGNVLWRLRKLFGFSYKLLYSNGAPSHPPYPKFDHIQQLTEEAFKEGANFTSSQTLLPYGFFISDSRILPEDEKHSLKRSVGIQTNEKIVISVAALDKRHKRIDHLINEISVLPHPRPFLLLLGDSTDETQSIITLGNEKLGKENFKVLSVPPDEVDKFLKISDLFVLSSLSEGFGRSVVEAALSPLPCIIHNSPTMKFILQEFGNYVNMEAKGELSSQVFKVLSSSSHNLSDQVSMLKKRFSWDVLLPEYSKMILSLTEPV